MPEDWRRKRRGRRRINTNKRWGGKESKMKSLRPDNEVWAKEYGDEIFQRLP